MSALIDVDQPSLDAGPRRLRCLVVGAGEAGRAIARDLMQIPEFGLNPIGFIDDDARSRSILGVPVLGTTDELGQIARRLSVEVVVVAIPSLAPSAIRRLAEIGAEAGANVRYLPSFVAAMERDARISDLRRLQVDLLLGRQEVHVVRSASRSSVAGKRVLVTGAGGSIGSELCRQIKGFEPEITYLLDHDESNLHRLQMQLNGKALLDSDDLIIADIRDRQRMRQVFKDLRPQVVFHAAAHKHLPLLERHPCEGVKSNVLGTKHLVEAAIEAGAERFILISTDKAADPTSVLGATKRLAEMVLQHYANNGVQMASVRFGNVLGSRGSFLSVLSEQIENGEEITVTHPEVTRFFMTIEEAAGLVIEAAGLASAAETFVLDMGEPVRIVDLVKNYAEQVHMTGDQVKICFTGLRPGEKLNEQLFSDGEERLSTLHPKIWATLPKEPGPDFPEKLEDLFAAAAANDTVLVRRLLAALLPEYNPPVQPRVAVAIGDAPYPDDY